MSFFRHRCLRKTVSKKHPLYGKVIYVHASMSPEGHVENTLQALQRWRSGSRP